jgi:hypothetical protein
MQDELRNFPQLTGTCAASSLQARGRVGFIVFEQRHNQARSKTCLHHRDPKIIPRSPSSAVKSGMCLGNLLVANRPGKLPFSSTGNDDAGLTKRGSPRTAT